MSIKTQKIIKYIPIINFIIMFCWINVYCKNVVKPTRFAKNLLKWFAWAIIIHTPRAILSFCNIPDWINTVLFWISVYFTFFSMAVVAIRDQEKFIKENQNK